MSGAWWSFNALPWALLACIVLAPRRPPYPRLLLVPVGALVLAWLTWLVLLWRGPTGGSYSLLLMFLVMVTYSLAVCGGWALRWLWDAAMRWRRRRAETGEETKGRRAPILLLILAMGWMGAYLTYRSGHRELWEHEDRNYLIFESRLQYYLFRPLSLVDAAATGIGVHIGPHRAAPGIVEDDAGPGAQDAASTRR